MFKAFIPLFVVLAIIATALLWFLGIYNGLLQSSLRVDQSWASVETQYQRRFDLVPNLVGATRGALAQEQEVFGAIAEARTRYAGAQQSGNVNEQVQAANQYESALARLMVIVENYPQLRSLDTVNRLMDELAGTENRVLIARDRYNEQVRIYNGQVRSFPTMLIAGMFGYAPRDFFTPTEGSQNAPTVDLSV